MASNSITSVASQIYVLSKITNARIDESEVFMTEEQQRVEEEGIPVTFKQKKNKKLPLNKARLNYHEANTEKNEHDKERISVGAISSNNNNQVVAKISTKTPTSSANINENDNQKAETIGFFKVLFFSLQ